MSKDLFDVQDRVVVVTGGLGQLGRQFSQALVDRGARVAVLDRVKDQPIMNEGLTSRGGEERFMVLTADVTCRESLEGALGHVKERWGTPHGLVNNAAIDSPPNSRAEENGPFETYPASSWDRVMDVNAKGVFICCQVIGAEMARAGRGSVINICSIYGMVSPDQRIYEYRHKKGQPFFKPVAYSASKSALLNMTRYLATYWAKSGIRVNTLTFGGVYNDQDDVFLGEYCARVPLGRMAREDEYNGAVVFLLSDASSYMTGSNLVLDGGWTAW
jgi:NAD(P)-dependent dehydrogenase (short-subunit alcohol dehydrogenase family)